MSGPLQTWYSSRDLDAFGERCAVLREELDLKRLVRLREWLSRDAGTVKASLEFAPRRNGWLPVELRFEARLQLTCQRCLEPFELQLAERVELAVVESASMESFLPDGCEAIVLDDERILPMQLLEDELIVSLPLAPRHEGDLNHGCSEEA